MQTTPQAIIDKHTEAGWWGTDTLNTLFISAAENFPDQLALVDPPNRNEFVSGQAARLSFQEIDELAEAFAARLYQQGLRQGDKVLLQMPNLVEIVLIYLAAARLGLIVSPVAMQYGQHELTHFAETIQPQAYIAFTEFRNELFVAQQQAALNQDCKIISIDGDEMLSAGHHANMDEYKAYQAGLIINANDIFTICWTSGTTGRSKGVPRSHNHWLSSTLASEDAIGLASGSVMLNPFPFVNMAAIGGFLYYWLKINATMILHHPFEPMVFLSQLQNEKVVYTIAPPAVLTRLLQTKDQIKAGFDLSKLQVIGSGSAPLSPHMISGFKQEFAIDVVNIFGSNEGMAILSSAQDVPDAAERAHYFPRFGSKEHRWSNRLAEQIETKLIDPETGLEVITAGTPGECLIRGATVFDGYYQSPNDNAEAFNEDGFFRSGDLFEIAGSNNQFYRFVGRCKSLIVRGGINISPEELDELIESHPAVLEGVAISYPDEVLGERICAVIAIHEGQEVSLGELVKHFEEMKVAKFKWPEKLKVVSALPRNAMNKVVRNKLAELAKS